MHGLDESVRGDPGCGGSHCTASRVPPSVVVVVPLVPVPVSLVVPMVVAVAVSASVGVVATDAFAHLALLARIVAAAAGGAVVVSAAAPLRLAVAVSVVVRALLGITVAAVVGVGALVIGGLVRVGCAAARLWAFVCGCGWSWSPVAQSPRRTRSTQSRSLRPTSKGNLRSDDQTVLGSTQTQSRARTRPARPAIMCSSRWQWNRKSPLTRTRQASSGGSH